MRVVVTAPSAAWSMEFTAEAKRLHVALGTRALEIHHIGSTAINGIFAKPIIDILLVTTDLEHLDHGAPKMVALGYEVMGEFGIPERRYFRKNSAEGQRTHQVHAFQFGSPHIERHLAFRDYMNAHTDAATAYSELKRRLAGTHAGDLAAYMDGKDPFIKEHELLALAWARRTRSAA